MKWAALLVACCAWGADVHITVAGLGGEPDYESRFTMLANETQKMTGGDVLTGQRSTRANLKAALERAAAEVRGEDTLTLVLIGHGTFDGVAYKFNLVGPDVSAEELKGWLDKVAGRQLVVLATSCSGGAIAALKAPNRTVVTATKSGTEKNAVVFGRYWVDSLRDASADVDKNGSVSAAESFQYAKQKTSQFYETQKRLATEHPAMEDGGGAGRFVVVRYGSALKAMNDPQKRKLLARKDELEAAIDRLKLEKAAMSSAEYKQKLNDLLVELAGVQEELDK